MVGWTFLIVVGLMVLAIGVQEVRTGQQAIRRLGGNRTPRRDGWVAVAIGAGLAPFGLSRLLDLPGRVGGVLLVAAIVAGGWAIATYRPREAPGRRVDPPSDPDGVWRRNPPGY